MKYTLALLALSGSILVADAASANQTSSPNRYVSAASQTGLSLTTTPHTLSVELTGSRKKRIVVVHVAVTNDASASSQSISAAVSINSIYTDQGIISNRCANGICTVSMTAFLDIDVAEAAHPGVFYNKLPLLVEARGYTTSPGINGKMTVVAELLKK